MKRTGFFSHTWILPIAALGLAVFLTPAPADAQLLRWLVSEAVLDGEPTDPDETLAVLNEIGLDPEQAGLSATPPASEAEADAWWSAILDLLTKLVEGDSSQ